MKLVWHIFQKDVRRLRLPLFLWGAVYVLQYIVFLQLRAGDNGRPRVRPDAFSAESYLMWLWGLELLAAWILVPQLIQDDPLIGDRAAWRTRPISGARMLAAKLMSLILVFCAAPTLLLFPWWFDLGFGAVEIVRLSITNMIGMAIIAGLAAAIATVTADFIRFLAWSFIVHATVGLGLFVIMAGMPGLHEPDVGVATLITRIEIAGTMVLLAAGAIIVIQYLARRYMTAVVIAAATGVSAGLVIAAWPWSGAEFRASLGGAYGTLPRPTISFVSSTLFAPPDSKRQKATLQVEMQFPATAEGYQIARWQQFDGVLRHGANGRLPVQGPLMQRSSDDILDAARSRVAREDGKQITPTPFVADWRVDLPAALGSEFSAGNTQLVGSAAGEFWEAGKSARFPLRVGAYGSEGLMIWHLTDVPLNRDPGNSGRGFPVEMWELEAAFTPGALLQGLGGDPNRWRKTRMTITGPLQFDAMSDNWDRPELRRPVRIGFVNLTPNNIRFHSNDRDPVFGRQLAFDITDSMVAAVTFRQIAQLQATAPVAPIKPDILIDGNLPQVLVRARTEHKPVLLISWAGDFSPGVQKEPSGWLDPAVRRLISERFLCAQIFSQDNPDLSQPRYPGDNFPKIFVLSPEGREQDAVRPDAVLSWRGVLEANLSGSNYATWLRQEIARRGEQGEAIRYRLSDALLARGEIEAAVDEMLDRPIGTRLFDYSRDRELARLAESPAVHALLEKRHAEAVTRLVRNPTDAQSALALYRASAGLHSTELWSRFPALMPTNNPLRWRLVSDWLLRTDPRISRRAAGEALNLEQFVAAGPNWAKDWLAEVRQSGTSNYQAAVSDTRFRLSTIGIRAIQVFVRENNKDAARRIATKVLQWNSSTDTRRRVDRALAGTVDRYESWWW